MKTTLKSILFLFLFAFSLQSCEDQDDVAAPADLQINKFIWRGLNEVYLWQQDVPNLADGRNLQPDFDQFLRGYSHPEDLFQDLLNKPVSKFPNGDAIDRFSWIVDDYTVLEQELSGVTKNNGVDFRLSRVASGSNDVVGFVRYIIPNSDASTKAIKRGDLFTSVNGTKLTVSNYQQLLLNQDSYTLDLADYNGTNYVLNGKSVALTKTVLEENPIFINKVIASGGRKIGYLMYNGFYPGYDDKLNQAFGELKSQGITDLILDLRYNGGGSVTSAIRLSSMITGQFDNQIFAKTQFNAKWMKDMTADDLESLNYRFVNNIDGKPLNSLNLTTVYIITTASTASASELIVNGLKPYINVVQIGETTTGKNVGSYTIYDSETLFTKKGINPNHKYAMQPLVFKISNSAGFGDYQQGLQPTYQQYERVSTYGVLGETSEPLLNLAISKITGSTAKRILDDSTPNTPYLTDSKIINGLRHGMYFQNAPKN
ncbi:S41 family peptidase [Flavobacterium tistrianum]|uniref:S41 family peptidase n=1 Tax=Flavobacterium tistrianum TaxID=1685414 RepID=UPI000DAC858F|nr:S41 family peptidase [Flavobacterium tistrianum]KAF2342500.1 peptidase S41 [Flavobacterium tistrianum]